MTDPKWLVWIQQVQALAQDGLAYTQNPFDRDRYHMLQHLAAKIMGEYSSTEFEKVDGLFTHEAGYATPKLDCRGVVFREGKLLLVTELADGGWTLPGGWVDVGEPPSLQWNVKYGRSQGIRSRRVNCRLLTTGLTPATVTHPIFFIPIKCSSCAI